MAMDYALWFKLYTGARGSTFVLQISVRKVTADFTVILARFFFASHLHQYVLLPGNDHMLTLGGPTLT